MIKTNNNVKYFKAVRKKNAHCLQRVTERLTTELAKYGRQKTVTVLKY